MAVALRNLKKKIAPVLDILPPPPLKKKDKISPNLKSIKLDEHLRLNFYMYIPGLGPAFPLGKVHEDVFILTEKFPSPDASIFV